MEGVGNLWANSVRGKGGAFLHQSLRREGKKQGGDERKKNFGKGGRDKKSVRGKKKGKNALSIPQEKGKKRRGESVRETAGDEKRGAKGGG